jgi:hypothetical protein
MEYIANIKDMMNWLQFSIKVGNFRFAITNTELFTLAQRATVIQDLKKALNIPAVDKQYTGAESVPLEIVYCTGFTPNLAALSDETQRDVKQTCDSLFEILEVPARGGPIDLRQFMRFALRQLFVVSTSVCICVFAIRDCSDAFKSAFKFAQQKSTFEFSSASCSFRT